MPPAISDDERSDIVSDDRDVLPPKKPAAKKAATNAKGNEQDEPLADAQNGDDQDQDDDNVNDHNDDDDDNDDEGADEYVVEEIVSHAFGEGDVTLYEVKWLGYESQADRTWEPEENLEGAMDILKAYWDSIGGKPQPGKPKTPAKGKRAAKRKSAPADTPNVESATKRGKRNKVTEVAAAEEFELPGGSWEQHIQLIEAIEEDHQPDGKMNLQVFVLWNDGKQRSHSMVTIRQKCPQKILDFYESKLVFKTSTAMEEV